MKPSYKPFCPNHGCALEGTGFPLPNKGEGICPVSGAHFQFEAEVDQERTVKGKDGSIQKKLDWKLSGDEKVEEI